MYHIYGNFVHLWIWSFGVRDACSCLRKKGRATVLLFLGYGRCFASGGYSRVTVGNDGNNNVASLQILASETKSRGRGSHTVYRFVWRFICFLQIRPHTTQTSCATRDVRDD